MLVQRFLFFLAKITGSLGGGLWGLAGAAYISENILRISSTSGPLLPMIILAVVGMFFGFVAGWFLVVLPMSFLFPNAREIFSWENPDPPFTFRFYQWYGKNLQEYGSARERGEP